MKAQKLEDRFAGGSYQPSVACKDEASLLLNCLPPTFIVDLGSTLNASSGLYLCARKATAAKPAK